MKLNYKPLYNNVVVKEPIISKTTKAGVIKPDTLTQEEAANLNKLEVVAVGPESKFVKVGDIISLNRFAPQSCTVVTVDDKNYLVIPENQVIGIYTVSLTNILDTASVVN